MTRKPFILSGFFFLAFVLVIGLMQAHGQQSQDLPPFPQQDATLLFPGALEVGSLDQDHPTRRYLVLAQAGDQLVVTASRATGDLVPKLRLSDATGSTLADQGADLAGRRATLKFPVTQRAWYLLEVGGEQGSPSGGYTLLLTGAAPEIYTVLPGGVPDWLASGETGILRDGSYPLAAGDTTLHVMLKTDQTLRLKLAGPGASQLAASAPDGSNPVQQQATGNTAEIEFPGAVTGWIRVTASVESGGAVLTVGAADSSGTQVAMAPDGLTGFVTVTPTPTPTATFTPTATPIPTVTPTPTPTKVVITSLKVDRPQSEAQVIATDTVWIFFYGFPELKAPGTKHLVSPLIYDGVYMLRFPWCADTEDMRTKSLPAVNVTYFIDGIQVDSSDILWFDRYTSLKEYCRYWATQLSHWPRGKQVTLKIVVDVSADVQLGFNDTRRAGQYIYELVMRVR